MLTILKPQERLDSWITARRHGGIEFRSLCRIGRTPCSLRSCALLASQSSPTSFPHDQSP